MHCALLAWGTKCHKKELLQKKALRIIFSTSPVANTETLLTRCTRGVRVVFSVTGMRSSSSARINKFVFRTLKKSCSVHMTVFEIVARHNVVNWIQLLT